MFFEFRTFLSRVPHIPAGAVSRVAAEAGVLLLKYNTSLQLWRLGQRTLLPYWRKVRLIKSNAKCSVADPDPGSDAFLTPGSGIWNRFFPDLGFQIPDPKPIFLRA
jgi:hypothetical protein